VCVTDTAGELAGTGFDVLAAADACPWPHRRWE
jgi:hypothetical protein